MSATGTRVSTWDDLVRFLQEHHAAETTESSGLRIRVQGPPGVIEVSPYDVSGMKWVEIVGNVGKPIRHVASAPILSRSFVLPIGIAGMLDGMLSLRQLLPIDGLDTADLDETVRFMTEAVSELQTR